MSQGNRPTDVQLQSIGQLRDWLELISAIRNFNQPIDSPDGLRQAIAILAQLGKTLGLDADWIGQFRAALENPAVFDIVLAVDANVYPPPSRTSLRRFARHVARRRCRDPRRPLAAGSPIARGNSGRTAIAPSARSVERSPTAENRKRRRNLIAPNVEPTHGPRLRPRASELRGGCAESGCAMKASGECQTVRSAE
jgi:hypothetical protein